VLSQDLKRIRSGSRLLLRLAGLHYRLGLLFLHDESDKHEQGHSNFRRFVSL
jgi:hypothetical protein